MNIHHFKFHSVFFAEIEKLNGLVKLDSNLKINDFQQMERSWLDNKDASVDEGTLAATWIQVERKCCQQNGTCLKNNEGLAITCSSIDDLFCVLCNEFI